MVLHVTLTLLSTSSSHDPSSLNIPLDTSLCFHFLNFLPLHCDVVNISFPQFIFILQSDITLSRILRFLSTSSSYPAFSMGQPQRRSKFCKCGPWPYAYPAHFEIQVPVVWVYLDWGWPHVMVNLAALNPKGGPIYHDNRLLGLIVRRLTS